MSNETAIETLQEKIDDLNQQAWELRVTDLPKAFELSKESVKLARTLDYPKGLAEGLRSLGFSYVRFFKNDEAAPLLKESLSLFQKLNDLKGQAVIYEYLGIIERNWGNLGASLDLLLKANEIVRQTGPPEVEITCCYQLGVTYKHLGNHENALDYLYRTLSLAQKVNNPLMISYATNIIGSIYFDNGDYKQALDCYQQGLIIRRESNDKWGEAGSLDNIGFTYLKLNDLDKAIDYCKQSLAICQGTGDKKGEANTLLHLGEIYEQAGDLKQAAAFSNISLEIRKARGDKRGETEVLLFLADLYKNRNDVEDHQIFEWLTDALKIADEIKAQDLLSKAYYNLHEYYNQKGDFKESLVQLEAHFQIERELHKNSINQKVANLEISHKAEMVSQQNKELTELNEQIGKANAELRIEASLERVRSRTMAMHKSEEVTSVAVALNEELMKLGFVGGSTIIIINKETGDTEQWTGFSEDKTLRSCYVPYFDHPFHHALLNSWKNGEKFLMYTIAGEEKKTLDEHYFSTGYKIFPESDKKWMREMESVTFSHAFMKYGAIHWGPDHLTDEQLQILQRFSKVFEQSYTRFLDLKKAEAQAREAQIETALEKVRSRSMAMHKSDELKEVIRVVLDQFIHLNINVEHAGFYIDYKNYDDMHIWLADPNIEPFYAIIPYFDTPTWNSFLEAKANGTSFHTDLLDFEEKNNFYESLFKLFAVPEVAKQFYLQCKGLAVSTVLLDNVGLYIENFSAIPYTDAENKILMRFGKVFQQTYTRFLDLQKAEVQAREAQIEAALEKIRSRSLAMHKSEELGEVINVVFDKLKEFIDTPIDGSSILIPVEDSNDIIEWVANPGKSFAESFRTPYIDHPALSALIAARKSGVDFFYKVFDRDEKNSLWKYVFEHSNYQLLPDEIKKRILESDSYAISVAFEKNSAIVAANIAGQILSEKEAEVLKRIARAFEQAYTRFLDLQKAEAQAREAQIQLSLERVRAKAMAMYHSDELNDVLSVLFAQFDALGLNPVFAHLSLFDLEKNLTTLRITGKGGKRSMAQKTVPIDAMDEWKEELANWKASKPSSVSRIYYPKEVVPQIWELFGDLFDQLPVESRISSDDFQNGLYCIQGNTGFGYIGLNHTREATDEEKDIILRFAVEFGRVYQRFLDLQRAEAQAREAQIETALEKIRSRSLAMRKSDELKDVIAIVFEKLKELGLVFDGTGIYLFKDDSKVLTLWVAALSEPLLIDLPFEEGLENSGLFKNIWQARRTGENIYNKTYLSDEKNKYFKYVGKHNPQIPLSVTQAQLQSPSYTHTVIMEKNSALMADSWAGKTLSDEEVNVLKRMAKVFEQAFTRFIDLQKAEAQAREGQIQLALERVRARAMAMQKPTEFVEVVNVMGEQFINLDFDIEWANFGANGFDVSEGIDTWNFAVIPDGNPISSRLFIPYFDHPLFIDAKKQLDEYKHTGGDFFEMTYGKEVKDQWLDHMFAQTFFKDVPKEYQDIQYAKPGYTTSNLILKDTWLSIGKFDARSFTDEQHNILRRFGNAFGQAYTRFLDLQKAEAQAREARIEAALERVRSRSLAMHKSDEMHTVVNILFDSLRELLSQRIDSVNINIMHEGSKDFYLWIAAPNQDYTFNFHLPYYDHPITNDFFTAIAMGKELHQATYPYEVKNDYFSYMFVNSDNKYLPEERKQLVLNGPAYSVAAGIAKHSAIFLNNYNDEILGAEDTSILLRFTRVFDQAYIRFLDLQKAEAQAREGQIQLALERVRARTMAMQRSDELSETSFVLFQQFNELGEGGDQISIGIFEEDEKAMKLYSTFHGSKWNRPARIEFSKHRVYQNIYSAWKGQKKHFITELAGKELESLNKIKLDNPDYQVSNEELAKDHWVVCTAFFSNGVLSYASRELPPKESIELLERFASVFDLTYTRFLDLQRAEAQAREAQIETALEKVRSRTLAMQKSDELADTAAEVFKQLIGLGIEPNRLYIGIVNDDTKDMEMWATDEDGTGVGKKFTFNAADNSSVKKLYDGWKNKMRSVTVDMQGEELENYFSYLQQLQIPLSHGLKQKRRVQNISYFDKGFIGMASPDEQSEDNIRLLERFAAVFNLTFTRFNDLKIAEAHALQAERDLIEIKAAKQKAEEALTELQATQKQLVQSEKMASLGELTAGIAHEIQNPLNFVNNFSDVSNELIEELKIRNEKLKIEDEEVKELLNDIASNLEKINHHGKRADAIVKGMLQHSRSSSGQKELTDINTLADEYIRLAYHGLRAKDKLFNAKFEMDLDPSIGKINIVPQEIGRVILNLINNSFYAVNEKKRSTSNGYEPLVAISTKKVNGRIEVKVKDNGNGIPKNVLDKIFQPFFTTKPTGQGTGLGLSLSYDIVTKGHDGEITVQTKEGEGSEFIISLPVK